MLSGKLFLLAGGLEYDWGGGAWYRPPVDYLPPGTAECGAPKWQESEKVDNSRDVAPA